MPLVRVVEALRFELFVVLPHPRYPLSSSAISLVIPTAGSVGSLLGLKPYSSTSFRRSSSPAFFCLRRLHSKIPARTNNATTTTGTTTAMAVLPPVVRPQPSFCFSGFCNDAGADVAEEGAADDTLPVACEGEALVMTDVRVTTMTGGVCPDTVGDGVMNEVMICVSGGCDEAVTTDVGGASDEEGGASLDDGACDD